MNILLTVTGWPDKKAPARSVFNLTYAKELEKQGHNVTVVYIRALHPKRAFVQMNALEGLTCFEMACAVPQFGPVQNTVFLTSLFKLLLKNKKLNGILAAVDVVHAIGGGAVEPAYILAKKYSIPLVSQFIGSDINRHLKVFLANKNFKKGVEKSTYLCFNSKGLQEVFCEAVPCSNNTKVLYRGVVLEDFKYNFNKQSDRVNLLFLGGFPEHSNLKGGHTLLDAIKLLNDETLNKRIKITIGGPNSHSYSTGFESMSTDKMKLDFIGAVDKASVKEKMLESHIVLIPSLSEGVPNVLYEAMASGNMVIASNVGGIPEILVAGKTGLLVESNGAIALMRALAKAINDENLVENYAIAGRKKIAEMDYDKFIQGYTDLYKTLLNS